MAHPKWKYTLDKVDGLRSTLVGNEEAEKQLGAAWVDDPHPLAKDAGIEIVPMGGPADASGKVAFGPAPKVPGVTKAAVGAQGAKK